MMADQHIPCPACGGSGQLSSFKGESRFLLTVEECPLCCGTGLAWPRRRKSRTKRGMIRKMNFDSGESMTAAKNGDSVKVHYTGTLEDGSTFDSSRGVEPLEFTLGSGQVIAGFDEAVVGMKPGEQKNVTVPADKAYGERHEEMVITVPRAQFPAHITPEVGQQLQLAGPNNQPILVRVVSLDEDSVQLDANPPLAGLDLTFDLELVSITE
jgi:peptidylprolyl isomerase